ncbi:duf229 domain containing protein [Stylonychia lemnae]|uniref:Duf229 domain containing protein n=1 Tax=Stylonychia lemnae TaxID=5949 RepID=A0A077ZUZ2_STYLE|nr:duf229 domain containing protein [Stylonychia lemnae]|eukprot:CDW73399.1 duf229 domain containing protein [Stylonychia lemnae]
MLRKIVQSAKRKSYQDQEDERNQYVNHSSSPGDEFTFAAEDPKFYQRPEFNLVMLIVSLITANALYQYVALQTCEYDGLYECIDKFLLPNLAECLILTGISALIFTAVLYVNLSCKNKTKLTILVLVLVNIFLMSITNTTIAKNKFGGMYGVAFILYVIIFTIILSIRRCILSIKPYMNLRRLLVLSFIVLLYFRFSFSTKVMRSCDNWEKGLFGEMIHSEKYCHIPPPKICMYELTDRIQDFSFIDCSNRLADEAVIEKAFGIKEPFVGLADTTQFTQQERTFDRFPYSVYKHSKGYSSYDEAKKAGHEMIVDVKDSRLDIIVNRNEKLVEERKKLQKGPRALNDNLIVIFVDALSRQRAHFKMPETMKFFKSQDTLEFYRFHGYHKRTYENALMYLYGMSVDDLGGDVRENKNQSVVEFFKEQGYIVGHAGNLCESNVFEQGDWIMRYIKNSIADHESLSHACDPHYHNPENSFGPFQGPFSIVRRCIYKRDTFEYVTDFGKKFMSTYKNEKKVMMLDFIDFHEGTGEVVNYLDAPLAKFLNEIQNEDTTIMLMSDHGFHMGGLKIAVAGYEYTTELLLPAMMVSNLKGLTQTQQTNIEYNQQKLITHKELFNFWKFWASGKDDHDLSFVSKMPDDSETCHKIGEFCKCQNFQSTPPGHSSL